MRVSQKPKLTDHDLLQDISANDHHPQVDTFKIQINSQAIAAATAYEFRQTLDSSNYKTVHAILRGSVAVQILGHVGVSVVGGDNTAEATSIAIAPYGGGGYLTSYMGAYSRLHGDTYLCQNGAFGPSIVLQEVYVDDDEAVLRFYNTHSTSSRNLTVYGMGICK